MKERELTNQDDAIENAAARESDPSVPIIDQEERQEFEKMLRNLREKDRRVIELRYGLGEDGKTHTFKEIGEMFGFGVQRARDIERRALSQLGLWREKGENKNSPKLVSLKAKLKEWLGEK